MFCDLWLIFCSFFCLFHCKCNTICKCNSSSIIFLRRSSFTTFGRTKISAYPEITASECNVTYEWMFVIKLGLVYSKVCEISFFLLQKYEEMRGPWNQQKTLPWARYICSMTISTIIGSIYARTHGFSCRWSFENFTF